MAAVPRAHAARGPAALHDDQSRAAHARAEEYSAIGGEVERKASGRSSARRSKPSTAPERAVEKAAAGLATLARLRERRPDLELRVDFHERFQPQDFFALVPQLERLQLDWIEEPFAVGPAYDELRKRTRLRISGGELFWGRRRFEEITEHRWCDVIMPDVKHVGGFGPLLDVLKMGAGRIEISPHNPSGPISTAASLHAAAVYPELVRSLEYSFQRQPTRHATGRDRRRRRALARRRCPAGVSRRSVARAARSTTDNSASPRE